MLKRMGQCACNCMNSVKNSTREGTIYSCQQWVFDRFSLEALLLQGREEDELYRMSGNNSFVKHRYPHCMWNFRVCGGEDEVDRMLENHLLIQSPMWDEGRVALSFVWRRSISHRSPWNELTNWISTSFRICLRCDSIVSHISMIYAWVSVQLFCVSPSKQRC